MKNCFSVVRLSVLALLIMGYVALPAFAHHGGGVTVQQQFGTFGGYGQGVQVAPLQSFTMFQTPVLAAPAVSYATVQAAPAVTGCETGVESLQSLQQPVYQQQILAAPSVGYGAVGTAFAPGVGYTGVNVVAGQGRFRHHRHRGGVSQTIRFRSRF